MLYINGVQMPAPSSYTFGEYDIQSENSGRNAQGDMLIEHIATKNKIELEWRGLTDANINKIRNAIKSTNFTVKYTTPDGLIEGIFYKGDRTSSMYNYNGGNPIWMSFKVNLIQQ